MAEFNSETVVQMTIRQLVIGVVGISGALWAIAHFTFGGIKSDISDIRVAVTQAQNRNADTHQAATTADSDLRSQFAGLTAELRVTNAGLTTLTDSVGGLNESIKSVDARLAASVSRQESFERYVAVRLGPIDAKQTNFEIPIQWLEQQQEVVPTLTQGDNPYVDWYRSLIQR
ncbi:hypothetical protein [Stappia sp. WLB 29]|uniref:hypothetical protein n=1 Tax=Stappia sp. WLB 29 TaxID=2925220 RepID=UPI0020C14D8F|nr:hypothetical protein [Stappia sp. WLB 29]